MNFVPEYRIRQSKRTLKVSQGKGKRSKAVTRTSGEHIMSFRLFKTLNYKDVVRLLNSGS